MLMVWQPSRRIWAGEDLEVDSKELEVDAMEGVETIAEKPSGSNAGSVVGAAAKSRGSTVSRSEGEIEE